MAPLQSLMVPPVPEALTSMVYFTPANCPIISYECKHCGTSNSSLVSITSNPCQRHPLGANKDKHEPAL